MILFITILFILFVGGLRTPDARPFGKDIVTVLKPFLAIGVMLFHLNGQSVWLHEFERWGPLVVGIFFFISGYGLTYSLDRNPQYLKNFFQRKIVVKLVLPCLLAWGFNMCLNETWAEYSVIGHLKNPSGPSLFPNDWFMYALIYCYISFMIAGLSKSNVIRLSILVVAPLLLVIFTSVMEYVRNWWATPLAFSVGVVYCHFETHIRTIVSDKRNFVLSNLLYLCIFGSLIVGSAFLKLKITTILAYSLLPLLLVNNVIRVDVTQFAQKRVILFLSGISFEIYLIHGIIIDFFKKEMLLSGELLIAVTIITVLVIAPVFKWLSQNCQKVAENILLPNT